MILASAQEGRQEVSGFQQSLAQSQSEAAQSQRQQQSEQFQSDQADKERQFKLDQAREQQARVAKKFEPFVNAISDVTTPTEAWDVGSKFSWMAVDPDTSKGYSAWMGTQAKAAAAEVGSLDGKMKIQDNTSFTKGLDALEDPSDRAAIKSMSRNKDGTPSAMAWQALSLAQERQKVHKENVSGQAEMEAMQRGDQEKTTITDKGVTKTFTPSKDASGVTPKEMSFGGVPYIVNPRTGNFVRRDKQTQELSVAELMREYRTAQKDPDANKDQIASIRDYVKKRFPNQASLFGVSDTATPTTRTTTTPTTTNSTSDDPLGILK